MATAAGFFTPNTNMVGLTPNQLRYGAPGLDPSQQFGGRIDELASTLGIGEQTPLENRAYSIVAGEGQPSSYISSQFKTTDPYQSSYDALGASKGITEQAYAERQKQLEAEKAPLNERYQGLIAELTRRETKETGAQSTALAREYGKRGVPLSSGAYEQDLLGKTGDISQYYGGQIKEVGFENADKLRELGNLIANIPTEKAKELNLIDQQIAQMKAQGADKQMTMALEMYKQQTEEKYNNALLDLKKQEFELTKQGTAPSLKDQFATVGEGSTLYDLLNRSALYTAPKTHKGEGGGSTLQDLESIFG